MTTRPQRRRRTYRSAARKPSKELTTTLERLGERVRTLRTERGLTQARLAEIAQLDDKHLQVIEHGGTNLTVSSLLGLATALDVTLAELFEGV